MKKIFIQAEDGEKLELHVFKTSKAKAVIQFIHGMEEHQERYEPFIEVLNKNGFSVVSSNLRGHGKNARVLGHFSDDKGYSKLIEDQKLITNYIEKHFKNQSIYLFAHSLGTIITRVLLKSYSHHYDKVVLSGYPNYQVGAYVGIVASNIIKFIRGPRYKSKLLSHLTVGRFNKKIKNPKTPFDWLCTNEKVIDDYIKDSYCGFSFTCAAYNDLYHLTIQMHKVNDYKNINKNIKLLLVRGLNDPCVGGLKGAEDSHSILKKAGFQNIQSIDYPNMRHEILNEEKCEDVYYDLLHFYQE